MRVEPQLTRECWNTDKLQLAAVEHHRHFVEMTRKIPNRRNSNPILHTSWSDDADRALGGI